MYCITLANVSYVLFDINVNYAHIDQENMLEDEHTQQDKNNDVCVSTGGMKNYVILIFLYTT